MTGKGIQSLSQVLAVAKRRDQWKRSQRKVRKERKERKAGSAAGAERSCSSSASACSVVPSNASDDGLSDGGMEADVREDSLSDSGHADGLGGHSDVHGDQAAGGRASWDPDIMQQHILRGGGWDNMFHLFAVPGKVSVGGIVLFCCPRQIPRPEGLNAAGADSSEDDWEMRRGVSEHTLATQWRGEGNISKTVFPGVVITKFGGQTVAVPCCTCSSLMSLQKALADNVDGLEARPPPLPWPGRPWCDGRHSSSRPRRVARSGG